MCDHDSCGFDGETVCRLSTECYAKRPSLGSYVYSHLIRQLETKEAMRVSKQHYHRLVCIAEAFADADTLAQGAPTTSHTSLLSVLP